MSFKERFKENKKIYIIRILFTTITLLWMGLIFFFSSQDGNASTNTSSFFVDIVLKIFHSDFDSLDPSTQEQILNIWSLVIRKAAHFTLFGVLGLLFFFTISSYGVRRYIYIYSVLSTCLYACSDEIHQMFVSSRAGMITDVLIDTSGSIVFLLITFLIIRLVNKNKEKKRKIDTI